MSPCRKRSARTLPALVAAISLCALASAPAAFGAGDPVASGTLKIKPGSEFKRQMRANRVHLRAGALGVRSGSMDPTSGEGTLRLRGKLVFKHGKQRLAYRHLVATLGAGGGALRSRHTRLFSLAGGSLSRNGFGADVSGIKLRFPASMARKLRKSFDLSSLHPGSAGEAVASEQPQTVQIVSGIATVEPASGPGSIQSKLAAHCIDPAGGVIPIAPGTQPGGAGTTFFYPIAFGTVGPAGGAGVIQQSGGIQISDGGSGLPSGCPASTTVTVALRDFSVDLQTKQATAQVSISGPGSPYGNLDAVLSFPFDFSDTLVAADPDSLAIAVSGARIELNTLAASMLNNIFPQPSPADPSMQLAPGDEFGTTGLSVQVR